MIMRVYYLECENCDNGIQVVARNDRHLVEQANKEKWSLGTDETAWCPECRSVGQRNDHLTGDDVAEGVDTDQ